jgi:putative glutamine amidotransferase
VSGRLPRVGLSSCFDHADPERRLFTGKTLLYVEESMVRWIQAAGVLVYPVPTAGDGSGPTLADVAADLDGLVLHGGADVCPRTYGEEPLRPEWEGDEVRDRYEIALVHEFRGAGKPVLGICRGLQLLNVALGGTLLQDISTQIETDIRHRDAVAYDRNRHDVDVAADTVLAELVGGAGRYAVNSVHHQSVGELAPRALVEARSSTDGVVEALRVADGGPWAYGVQWHPEFYGPDDSDLLDTTALRAAFIDQVRRQVTG